MKTASVYSKQAQDDKPYRFPIYQPSLGAQEKHYVMECLNTNWISSKGKFIECFERDFAQYIGSSFATTVCNGTVAIHLALMAAGIGSGDEVIVPTLTYVATINTIVQAGAKPVFVDSLDSTLQVDVADIERKITPHTKAIMIVHLYGLSCEMGPILALCKKHSLILIEDCAEAFGTYYKGQHVGTFGDLATFSFYGNKTISTGEGGMVVTNQSYLQEQVYHLKTQAVSKTVEYWHDSLGYNYRMTNICAAIGVAQLERADEIIAQKRRIAQWYQEGLTKLPLRFHDETPNTTHSFWMCTIILNNREDQKALRNNLKINGVETRPLFTPCHQFPHLKTDQIFPVAESLSARGINLPSYPDLTQQDVKIICNIIREYFEGRVREVHE